MNWNHQRELVKPTAKCCYWCKNFEHFECSLYLKGQEIRLTHRQNLKILRGDDFRCCKSYRYSKINFKNYKKECEENKNEI